MAENQYTEDNIRSLDWKEHIRLRPGMYIGKLGDGAAADDGIYILVTEVDPPPMYSGRCKRASGETTPKCDLIISV